MAATSEEVAREAVRKIKVDYEVLPHFVNEDDLGKAGSRAKAAGEKVTGDPEKALQDAEAVSEGTLRHSGRHPLLPGTPRLRHPVAGRSGSGLAFHPGCVTGWAGTWRRTSKSPPPISRSRWITSAADSAASSAPDAWGRSRCPPLAESGRKAGQDLPRSRHRTADRGQPSLGLRQDQGGRQEGRHHHRLAIRHLGHRRIRRRRPASPPLRLLQYPQHAPESHFRLRERRPRAAPGARPTTSRHRSSPAPPSKTSPPKSTWTPWRSSIRTPATPRAPNSYRFQFKRPPRSAEWKKLWQPRGIPTPARCAAGLASASTPGAARGHASTCRTTINPDGSVLVEMGTQDLGTGTRTIMTQVAAETLGLPMSQIKLVIGDNSLPPGGSSGGSTTVGGRHRPPANPASTRWPSCSKRPRQPSVRSPNELEAVDGTRSRQGRHREEHDLDRGLQEDWRRR